MDLVSSSHDLTKKVRVERGMRRKRGRGGRGGRRGKAKEIHGEESAESESEKERREDRCKELLVELDDSSFCRLSKGVTT